MIKPWPKPSFQLRARSASTGLQHINTWLDQRNGEAARVIGGIALGSGGGVPTSHALGAPEALLGQLGLSLGCLDTSVCAGLWCVPL